MTKVSIVLYYWILVAAVLLFARTAGLADNNAAIVKILIVVTILYVGVAMISRQKGKDQDEKRAQEGPKDSSAVQGVRHKKKHK